jgi:AcrR family transcriptional regulator
MAHPAFTHTDFLDAALALAAGGGPRAVTVAAVTERLKAPTGSFYHRFASRDVLLAELWLRTIREFQVGISAALDAEDGLKAALHTPAWVRQNLDKARLLLLHHRDDFIAGDWPRALRDDAAAMVEEGRAHLTTFARFTFGGTGPDDLRRAAFLLAEVPVAAVRQHLYRREPPPAIVDELIATTFHAVIGAWRGGRTSDPGRAFASSHAAPEHSDQAGGGLSAAEGSADMR